MTKEETKDYVIQDNDLVTMTVMNHLTEIQYMRKMNSANSMLLNFRLSSTTIPTIRILLSAFIRFQTFRTKDFGKRRYLPLVA